ncbi:hypothetical protein KP509_09G085200 [Ceratopteris richardii]|uniref:Uncharacterized protein n=1 Tax=Ceratopteris richardii TaxID=49495 RepID=A0A8T2U9Y0_CERRI|nr:hypothetical protein KP509_09G085200 [Ceratopteris richardii]
MGNLVITQPCGYHFTHRRTTVSGDGWPRMSRFSGSNVLGVAVMKRESLKLTKTNIQKIICRSDLLDNAPFLIAIAASIIISLVAEGNEGEHGTEKQVRNDFATLISVIPLFNWLAWLYLFLDTRDVRHLMFASVYIAPYIKTGFSLSPGETFLLTLGYVTCVYHIQLEIYAQGSLRLYRQTKSRSMNNASDAPEGEFYDETASEECKFFDEETCEECKLPDDFFKVPDEECKLPDKETSEQLGENERGPDQSKN